MLQNLLLTKVIENPYHSVIYRHTISIFFSTCIIFNYVYLKELPHTFILQPRLSVREILGIRAARTKWSSWSFLNSLENQLKTSKYVVNFWSELNFKLTNFGIFAKQINRIQNNMTNETENKKPTCSVTYISLAWKKEKFSSPLKYYLKTIEVWLIQTKR